MEAKVWPTSDAEYLDLVKIGQGATAEVFKSKTKGGDTVAVKKISSVVEETFKTNTDTEIKIWSSLNNDHIVHYYTSFNVDDERWIISEYMDVGSIRNLMQYRYPKGLKEDVVRPILRQTLLGLQYLHGNKYIHRDIKAGNLLLNRSGEVKITDFGVSASLIGDDGKEKKPKTFTGSSLWMAPEVLEQPKEGYTVKADLWSFGITIIELIEGKAPYEGLNAMKVVLNIITNDPPTFSEGVEVSKRLKHLLGKCLIRDAKKRASAATLSKGIYLKKAPDKDYLKEHILKDLPSLPDLYKEITAKKFEEIKKIHDEMKKKDEKGK